MAKNLSDKKILKLFGKYYGTPFYHREAVLRFARKLLKNDSKESKKVWKL